MIRKYFSFALSVTLILSSGYQAFSQDESYTIDNESLYSNEAMVRNASKAFNIKNYQKASFLYSRLSKKFPKNEEYLMKLADIFFITKDYDNAYQKYYLVIKYSKNNLYVNRAEKKIKEIDSLIKNKEEKDLKDKKDIITNKDIIIRKVIELVEDEKDNYLCNEKDPSIFGNHTDESFRRWEKEDLPIKIYIPLPSSEFNISDPEKYVQWTKNSLQRWLDKVPSLIKYIYVDSPDQANVKVIWSNYFKDESWGRAQMPYYDETLKRKLSNINLAIRAKLSDKQVFFSEPEFMQIATHEVGHTLGLAHSYKSYDNNDMMYPSYRSMIPGSEPDITQRDINSLQKLYSLDRKNIYKCK